MDTDSDSKHGCFTKYDWCHLVDLSRFITKKYSSAKKQLEATPATACTGALA